MDRTITAASTSASTSSTKTVTPRRKTSAGSLWTFSMPSLSARFRKGSADTASTSESSIFDAVRKPSDATTTTAPEDEDKEPHHDHRRSVTFSIPDTDDEDEAPAASNKLPPPTHLKPPSSASSTSRTPTVQLITTFTPTNIYLLPPLPSFHTPPLSIRSLRPLLPPPHLPGRLPDSLDPSKAPIIFTLTNNALYAHSPANNTSQKRPASILSTASKKAPTDPPLATFALPWSINKPTTLTLPHAPTAPSLYLHTDMFDKRGLQWADPVSPASSSSSPADDTPSAHYSCRRTKQPGEWGVKVNCIHYSGLTAFWVLRGIGNLLSAIEGSGTQSAAFNVMKGLVIWLASVMGVMDHVAWEVISLHFGFGCWNLCYVGVCGGYSQVFALSGAGVVVVMLMLLMCREWDILESLLA
ncbi:hypothetical protein EX30DRAFT_258097 [Ascodesmis nigricans]|uniref:Uncharacterized protein n=1 Tax=Ascodesmis nigricans TaxID=341454 RepID=A0A4S2MHX1_9PEZI|nr:hypothetical protein EX30DRAFT_258097 [Ascodesmis nigricans]